MKINFKSLIFSGILLFFIFYPFGLTAGNKLYNVSLSYDNNEIKLTNILVRESNALTAGSGSFVGGDFRYELVSFQGKVLEMSSFNFLTPVMDLPIGDLRLLGEVGNEVVDAKSTITLSSTIIQIPYHLDGDKINIYNNNKELKLAIDVSLFSEGCGNKKCEAGENTENCSNDCPPLIVKDSTNTPVISNACGNKKCESGENTGNCPNDCLAKTGEDNKTNFGMVIAAIILVVVSASFLLYYFFIRKKNGDIAV